MHRDIITHVVVTKTEFVVTASCDGHVKFWKKMEEGIEFVKHFRSHLGAVTALASNCKGSLLCSVSNDKSLKVFDVINFGKYILYNFLIVYQFKYIFFSDMINMMRFDYIPNCAEWIHSSGDAISTLAISDSASNKIYIYDGQGQNTPLHVFEKLHTKPVVTMKYNPVFDVAISVDKAGILEYWSGAKSEFKFPKCVQFDSKLDTDLFEFAKNKTYPTGLAFTADGKKFAAISVDRKVRVFYFLTGKLSRVLDESLPRFTELQQATQQLPNMEFGRRYTHKISQNIG